MKRLILILMGATFIFFSCSKDDSLAPDLSQSDQEINLKKGNMKVPFSGIETFYAPGYDGDITVLPNGKTLVKEITATWIDGTDKPLTTGLTDFYFNILWDGAPMASSGKFWGKAKLTVMDVIWVKETEDVPGHWEPVNVNQNNGTWDITFHGPIVLKDGVLKFTAYGTGIGKSGLVKGMVSHTVYVLDTSLGFYYQIDGYYINKKCHPRGRRHHHGSF